MGSLSKALKWASLENLSMMVSMVVLPADTDSLVTKSRVMCDQGRCGMGSG